jgi:hypothetical protein
MRNRTQPRSRICMAGVGLAAAAMGYSPSASACLYGSPEVTYLPGRYTNAHLGDIIAENGTGNSVLKVVVAQLNESITHVLMVQDANGFTISENAFNPFMIQGGWDQTHPKDPHDMTPTAPPGVLDNIYADGVGNYYQYYYGTGYINSGAPHAEASGGLTMVAEWATGIWGGDGKCTGQWQSQLL